MPRLSRSTSLAVALAIAVLGVALQAWWRWQSAPVLVADEAGLLAVGQRERIETFHDLLLKDYDIDYRLVTTSTGGDPEGAAVSLFEEMSAGGRSRSGRGLLLVIDPAADLVRLEVGHALEGVFPDAFAAYVEHRQMVPFFERNRVADGILATTELIVDRAQKAAADASFEDEPWMGSGGGGATAPARLGAGPSPVPTRSGLGAGVSSRRETPLDTVAAYLATMEARNADPDLPIYTAESREMLRRWAITPAQMDMVARVGRACPAPQTIASVDGARAVVRFPPAARGCSPYFLVRQGDGWSIDFVTMQEVVRFGRSNEWRLAEQTDHPYAFAFEDWRFDRNGFPMP